MRCILNGRCGTGWIHTRSARSASRSYDRLAIRIGEPTYFKPPSMNYKYAIVREPDGNFANGLTTVELGSPDIEKALAQHKAYCDALKSCGVDVTVLPTLPEFPDCPF